MTKSALVLTSSALRLYHASSSYYSMIARLALLEAGIPFEGRRMDIHIRKDQLAPWYVTINPGMTVPALSDGARTWRDSRDILGAAAQWAGDKWMPNDDAASSIVDAHYQIPIERLTFSKAMSRILPARILFPRFLRRVVSKLEAELPAAKDPAAVSAKIAVNRARLAYFTEGDLGDKLEQERQGVRRFLASLPAPQACLLGNKPSSADVVVLVLLGRLKMIGEWSLLDARPDIALYFERMATRPAFAAADIWTQFQPLRILLRR